MVKIIKLINRYNTDNVDQEFFDLEFARLDHEQKIQEDLDGNKNKD
jgi:hypothetical protein